MALDPRSSAVMLVMADTIEVSDQHRQVALYQWLDVRERGGDATNGTWCEGTSNHSGTTMYALLELAQRAGLSIAAWKDGERL